MQAENKFNSSSIFNSVSWNPAVAYIIAKKKLPLRLLGGPPGGWGPWARAHRAHWIRWPCLWIWIWIAYGWQISYPRQAWQRICALVSFPMTLNDH